jgi:hypothetical protein
MLALRHFGQFRAPWEKPVLQERAAKSTSITDSQEIFRLVKDNKNKLTYKEAG